MHTVLLTSALLASTAFAFPAQKRDGNAIQDPTCTGRGSGYFQPDNLILINQIDITKNYDIPWDSTSLSTGRTRLSAGEPTMNVGMETPDGGSNLDRGTITGLTLQYQLGLLTTGSMRISKHAFPRMELTRILLG